MVINLLDNRVCLMCLSLHRFIDLYSTCIMHERSVLFSHTCRTFYKCRIVFIEARDVLHLPQVLLCLLGSSWLPRNNMLLVLVVLMEFLLKLNFFRRSSCEGTTTMVASKYSHNSFCLIIWPKFIFFQLVKFTLFYDLREI